MEYNDLLAEAAQELDPMRRLALIAAFQVTMFTSCERSTSKPFNPMLGETYELVTDKFQFLTEQVSHHPPINAVYCKGKDFIYQTTHHTITKFTAKALKFDQKYMQYVHLSKFDETYEIKSPPCSVHNLVIGKIYIDLGETGTVTCMQRPNERAEIKYIRRGWFSDEAFKIEGLIYKQMGQTK